MSLLDIYLLLLGLFGALAVTSVVSALLQEGSLRVTVVLLAITGGFYVLAKRGSEGSVTGNDISAAISKLVNMVLG